MIRRSLQKKGQAPAQNNFGVMIAQFVRWSLFVGSTGDGEAACKFVVMARQVPTNTGMPRFGKLQVSNFPWIMSSKAIAGGASWPCNFPGFVDNGRPVTGIALRIWLFCRV
jgi:hypothetical protein